MENTYWKIQFTHGLEGFGWIKFNQAMENIGLYDFEGNLVDIPVEYNPIEFDTQPDWA